MEKEHLPRPYQLIRTNWKYDEIREALEKSREALLNLSSISTSSPPHELLLNLPNLENLFLVDTTEFQADNNMYYESYSRKEEERGGWKWGSKDMMLDFRLHDDDATTTEQFSRMAILTAAANLTGHVLLRELKLSEEEERALVEALSLAAYRHAGPTTLHIHAPKFRDAHALLGALKRHKRLKHLSLQWMDMSHECVEVLSDFTSLRSLHLYNVIVSSEEEFVGRLADLHPSHSPLAASLHRLHIHSYQPIDWRCSTGFLHHWPQLKELSLNSDDYNKDMKEEELMDFMDHLAPPKNGVKTAGSSSTLPSFPPQLYSLQLGNILGDELSRSATAAVVDALSRSGLPFFHILDFGKSRKNQPVIEAQLKRNQHNFLLAKDSTRVAATSMRLFICGDPFAGKTTLISTMRSMYGTRKGDKLIRPLFPIQGRTRGIEVAAIEREGIRVSVWDMAGQHEFHAFHDCMFPDIGSSSYQLPSMFMFVWSPIDSKSSKKGALKNDKNFEASFRYWLRFLASKRRKSKIALRVMVVFTRADQMATLSHAFTTRIDSLRSDFKGVINILNPPFHVNARKKDSMRGVASHIFDIAKDMLQGIQLLPPPHQFIRTMWTPDEIQEALEKSREALLNLSSISASTHDLLINLPNLENLFIVDTTKFQVDTNMVYASYGRERGDWEWGSRDMMLDFRLDATSSQMPILTATANFTGHLLLYNLELSQEEERDLVEALSLAADRHVAPSSLHIHAPKFRDVPALLSALERNKRLKHLSLQGMEISDDCMEMLREFDSLTSLHLHAVQVSEEFVVKLAGLHASLHRLHINGVPIDWRRSTGFLRHWPQLEELSLYSSPGMKEEELMDFMDHLAPPKNGLETAGSSSSTLPSSPPQLYSLQLGALRGGDLSRSATAAVVDALSRSGLPFFHILDDVKNRKNNPAIEAQVKRNQRNFLLGLDSTRVAATSMRLFICGDPFAGKSTLISTMRSMYGTRKRDKCMRALFATQGRTRGIEVGAIEREGIRVSLWDMAGQSEFHAFHDCMFPDVGTSSYQLPSMFMFVWSPIDSKSSEKGAVKNERNFEASFRYWLRFLASKSRQSNITLKVIVVLTRADQMATLSHAFTTPIASLRSDFKGVIDIFDPPFHVDARRKDSMRAVASHIFDIAKHKLQSIQVYKICTDINKLLSEHLKSTNERIITWETFGKIYPTSDKAKLEAVALCLNESGNIIYINGIRHIVLNPNWFCNKVMGSLIHFSNFEASRSTIPLQDGCTPRHSLEDCLQSVVKSKVKGSLLVDLMEAMHLCCKVTISNGVPNSLVDHIFIPTLLADGGTIEKLQWRSLATRKVDDDTFVYMGRRLECEDKDHTFLTPGLFPRVQVLFNKAFQSLEKEYKPDVMLGKDFISICFPTKEIMVVFCQAKSEHAIDVLVRAYNPKNSQQEHTNTTLVDLELKQIINTLVTICAQPTGIQGVKLIESVIRPDSLHYPSRARDREDQCVEITYLKEQLRRKILQGERESYEWKWTRQTPHPLQNDFIDLLGSEIYGEVLRSCKAWLKETVENPLLYSDNDEINVSSGRENQQTMIVTSLENTLLQHLKDEMLDEATNDEVRSIKIMAKAISILYQKLDANHKEILEKMDAMHQELQSMRQDVIIKVEKSISKLLKLAMENKAEKQLPRIAVITSNGHEKNVANLVTSLFGALSMQIHLYCEHEILPHAVENQPGITLTSWSESRAESLQKVLPYINYFLSILTTAIKLGINSMAPLASSFIPDLTPHLKLAKEHPMISSIIKSKFDGSNSMKTAHVCSSTSEYFKEWQTCLAFILEENGGVTDQNIAEKFCLWRAKIDGGNRVAWLCKKHYDEQRPTWFS